MSDRAYQALHLLALDPVSETLADPNVYGFRPHRSTADAVAQCFNVLCRKTSAQWVLEGDIKSCFDEIDHQWSIESIPMDTQVLRKCLRCGFPDKEILFHTQSGAPQGDKWKAFHFEPYAYQLKMQSSQRRACSDAIFS